MSAKTSRGTKRRCQHEECGLPFYDLNRTQFACPMCGTPFDLEAASRPPVSAYPAVPARKTARILPIVAADPVEAEPALADGEAEAGEDVVIEDGDVAADAGAPILEEDDAAEEVVDVDPPPARLDD